MLIGIFIQMIAIILFTILGLEFLWRVHKQRPARPKVYLAMDPSRAGVQREITKKIRWMIMGLCISTVFIFIR